MQGNSQRADGNGLLQVQALKGGLHARTASATLNASIRIHFLGKQFDSWHSNDPLITLRRPRQSRRDGGVVLSVDAPTRCYGDGGEAGPAPTLISTMAIVASSITTPPYFYLASTSP